LKIAMHLDDMRLFVTVARSGSFSSAARRLNLSPAAVSTAIKRIETEHRARLIERSTRAIRLTSEGVRFLAGCEAVLAQWEETLATLGAPKDALAGEIHIAAPADLSYQYLAKWLADWQREHPRLRLTLLIGDRMHDLKRESVDLAVRYGGLGDSALVAHPLCSGPRLPVASSAYLERVGSPKSPADLAHHAALLWSAGEQRFDEWQLWRGRKASGISEQVHVSGPLCADGVLARQWAIEGRGIAFKVLWDVIDDLEAGRLVRVLPEYRGDDIPVHAVLPSREHQPPRVRALLAHLRAKFKEMQQRMNRWWSTA
jgi:DNA-binding transcriptional LysR family regulator